MLKTNVKIRFPLVTKKSLGIFRAFIIIFFFFVYFVLTDNNHFFLFIFERIKRNIILTPARRRLIQHEQCAALYVFKYLPVVLSTDLFTCARSKIIQRYFIFVSILSVLEFFFILFGYLNPPFPTVNFVYVFSLHDNPIVISSEFRTFNV